MGISLLSVWAVVVGAGLVGFCVAFLAFTETMKAWVVSFPRNIVAGRMLAAIDMTLVTWLLLSEGFEWVDTHRQLIFIAAPISYFIIVFFMDELLAVRALGGLMLLIPFWILAAAFEHSALSRLLMTTFAYLVIVGGMVLVWSPHLFRRFTGRLLANKDAGKVFLLLVSVLGLAMIILGLTFF
jgi:hypothetical protein